MADSLNALRKHFLENGYDWLLLNECDVYTPPDILERLLSYNMQILSALYFSGEKSYSYPVLTDVHYSFTEKVMVNHSYITGFYHLGEYNKPQKIVNAGLGLILIYKNVLKQVPFRSDRSFYPDTMFAMDLSYNNIQNYYVPIMCRHENQIWDIQRKLIGK